MKLLLRSILLLALLFLNGYSSRAVPSERRLENTLSAVGISPACLQQYVCHQSTFHQQHLPGQSKQRFRKARGIHEEDDDTEAEFACLKKAKDSEPSLNYSLAFLHTLLNDPSSAECHYTNSDSHTFRYSPYVTAFSTGLYRLYGVFRI